MKNKLISLLMLLVPFLFLYLLYYYFFVLNKGIVILQGNIDNYEVFFYATEIKTKFHSSCKNKKCELIDLAPFSYEISINKEGYKTYKKLIQVPSKTTVSLDFVLEKQLKVEKIETQKIEEHSKGTEATTTTKDKINQFKIKAFLEKSYKYFEIGENEYFYFVDNQDETLALHFKKGDQDSYITNFIKDEKKNIDVQKIYGDEKTIFIDISGKKYFFDTNLGKLEKMNFSQKISYIKKNKIQYQLVTESGTYLYNTKTQKTEYFDIFSDFLEYENSFYLAIIYEKEKEKKQKFHLSTNTKNLIVKYSVKDENIKVLEETPLYIDKIIQEGKEIFFYDKKNQKYQVSNID